MKLAVISHSAERRDALANEISRHAGHLEPQVKTVDSYSVFQGKFQGADIIFLSIESMNDVEVGRKLAQFFPDIPLVVISGSAEYSVEAFALGARDYLTLPLDAEAFLSALARSGAPLPGQGI